MRRQLAIFSLTMPLSICALAHEHDHNEHASLGAHEHGVASLNLAIDGNQVMLELDSPAVNLLGFEHAASQPEDIAKVAAVKAQLRQADQLFELPAAADCSLSSVALASPLFAVAEHEHEHEHEEHAHESDHDHAEHEHKGHEHPHADIEASYSFTCNQPEQLSKLQLPLFKMYPGLQRLNVQAITASGQMGAELTAETPVIRFE